VGAKAERIGEKQVGPDCCASKRARNWAIAAVFYMKFGPDPV